MSSLMCSELKVLIIKTGFYLHLYDIPPGTPEQNLPHVYIVLMLIISFLDSAVGTRHFTCRNFVVKRLSKPENGLFWVWNLESWKMKYQVGLETGNWKPGFWNPPKIEFEIHNSIELRKMFKTQILTAESCRKTKTNNQQLVRKLKLKYEVNLRFETRINVWVQTQKWKTQKWEAEFQVYFNRPIVHNHFKWGFYLNFS